MDRRFADVGKPFDLNNVHATGNLPKLGRCSIPVSYKCMMPLAGNDVGYCKGLKFDTGKHFSASARLEAACAAPSAVMLAFVTAAMALETGHIRRV